MAIVKHLFQRTITKNGKKIKVWYYWYKDDSGKVIRKSCGQNKKPCLTKREAQEFVANLKDEDLSIKQSDSITIEQFTKGMFDEDSKVLIKLENRGIIYRYRTRTVKKQLLEHYIIPKFGKCTPDQVTNKNVENWLLEIDRSNSLKNQIINILNLIFQELYDNDLISVIPVFHKLKLKSVSDTGILSREEIDWLFPVEDYDKLISIWKLQDEQEYKTFTYATLFYMTLTMGLRSGEVRAIHLDQIRGDFLILNKMIDSSDTEVDHLKKGTDTNKRWRVVAIPEKTKKLLNDFIKMRPDYYKTEYLFELYGSFIKSCTICRHFQLCLKKNGIDYKKRNLHIHSLRFTCNSMLRHHIPEDILRSMIGHSSQNMTDYYDKSDIQMKEDVIASQLKNINDVW